MESREREKSLLSAFWQWSLGREAVEWGLDFASQIPLQNVFKIVTDKPKFLKLSLNCPSASSQ